MASFFCDTLSYMIHKTVKNSAKQLSIYARNSVPNSTLQLLYCVWAIPVYAFFQVSPKEEVRDREVRRPYRPLHTWKCSSSLINTLRTPPIHCQWIGFEMAWHHIFIGVRTLPPTHHRRTKVCSETCQSVLHHPVLSPTVQQTFAHKIYCNERTKVQVKFTL